MFRKMTWPKFILELIVGYLILYIFSPSMANFGLALILVGLIPFLVLRAIMLDVIYKKSINIVDRKFILNQNALHNEHCTVIYTPDEKIVVMDNITDRQHQKRMFTLTKKMLKINRAWNRVCRIFDSFTNLDSLEAFYNYDTRVEVLTLKVNDKPKQKQEIKIEQSNAKPRIVEMREIQADSFGLDDGRRNKEGSDFVDINDMDKKIETTFQGRKNEEYYVNIDSIKKQEKYIEKSPEAERFIDIESIGKKKTYQEKEFIGQETVGMKDLVNEATTKINVNAADAPELSLLPGINIVIAKKLVEHRNINGDYKSIEEFLSVANVKEHFISKIKEMIQIGHSKDFDPSADDYENGRIVDL